MGWFKRNKKEEEKADFKKPTRFIKPITGVRRLKLKDQEKVYEVEIDIVFMDKPLNTIPFKVKARSRDGALDKARRGLTFEVKEDSVKQLKAETKKLNK